MHTFRNCTQGQRNQVAGGLRPPTKNIEGAIESFPNKKNHIVLLYAEQNQQENQYIFWFGPLPQKLSCSAATDTFNSILLSIIVLIAKACDILHLHTINPLLLGSKLISSFLIYIQIAEKAKTANLNLTFSLSTSRLINRHFDSFLIVCYYNGSQRTVLGMNLQNKIVSQQKLDKMFNDIKKQKYKNLHLFVVNRPKTMKLQIFLIPKNK